MTNLGSTIKHILSVPGKLSFQLGHFCVDRLRVSHACKLTGLVLNSEFVGYTELQPNYLNSAIF